MFRVFKTQPTSVNFSHVEHVEIVDTVFSLIILLINKYTNQPINRFEEFLNLNQKMQFFLRRYQLSSMHFS